MLGAVGSWVLLGAGMGGCHAGGSGVGVYNGNTFNQAGSWMCWVLVQRHRGRRRLSSAAGLIEVVMEAEAAGRQAGRRCTLLYIYALCACAARHPPTLCSIALIPACHPQPAPCLPACLDSAG